MSTQVAYQSKANKVEQVMHETTAHLARLKQENTDMISIADAHKSGSKQYKHQYKQANQEIFRLVKFNDPQNLHRLLKV